VCTVTEALCLVSNGHYTESYDCSVSGEEKGRHAVITSISHLKKRETRLYGARLPFT
jgi:hypothetical protein